MKIYAVSAKHLHFAYVNKSHFLAPKIFIFNIKLLFTVHPFSFKAVQFIQLVNYFSIIVVITVLLICSSLFLWILLLLNILVIPPSCLLRR